MSETTTTVENLPPEVAASYSVIIDSILEKSDLNTISAKAIRKGLQAQVEDDISAQKKVVTALIMERFDKFNAQRSGTTSGGGSSNSEPAEPKPAKTTQTNGTIKKEPAATVKKETNGASKKRASPTPDSDELSSLADTPPPKKRAKIEGKSNEESDAAYAKRLQAELNRLNVRSTRGGGSAKRKPVVKKARKKKSKDRVGSDDDSDAKDMYGEKKEVKRTGGFHKPMTLSAPLSALLNGETQLSRPQTVKKIWEYIKERDLQDPSDKRQIICDDALKTVFKTDKVHMFTMNKLLNQNLYAADE